LGFFRGCIRLWDAGRGYRGSADRLGFSPLAASGLSLIANTAPVAYGALGTPIARLASVTWLDPYLLGAMVGRQLRFFSPIVAGLADLRFCRLSGNGSDLAGDSSSAACPWRCPSI